MWGGHENWAADRGCHAATCSWKEIQRKRGCIHGRSSPNPPPAQVTKPAPRRIGGTQAHKLLLRGFGAHDRKSCHLHRRLISTRHHVIIAGHVMSLPQTQLTRTALAHIRYAIALPFTTNVIALAPASKCMVKELEIEVLMAGCPAATCWASYSFVLARLRDSLLKAARKTLPIHS